MRLGPAALAATVALAVVAAAAAPPARAAVVHVVVESSTASAPLFDGTVDTSPHAVDGGDGSGPHPCSGPPGSDPAPTATGALDDAMHRAGIGWRGNWDPSFRDFFVDRIGPYASQPPDLYWGLTVNGRFTAGGCLTTVTEGDTVRFRYGAPFGPGPEPVEPEGGEEDSTERSDEPPDSATAPGGDRESSPRQLRRLRRVAIGAGRYLRRHRHGAGAAWARLAMAVRGPGDPARAAARLLGRRLRTGRSDGSLGGDPNVTSVAVLALRKRRPGRAARAAAWLVSRQGRGGGIGHRAGAPPDVDTTALAAWALAVTGRRGAARAAASFVREAQATGGGFPSLPGGAPNSQSTGLALVALRVAGLGPRAARSAGGLTGLDHLASLARRDGSISYAHRSSPTPIWSTAQALLGLSSKRRLLSFRPGAS